MSSFDLFIANLWRWAAMMPELPTEKLKLEELRRTEWSPEFEQLMRNRLIMGAWRYHRLHDRRRPAYDCVGSIIKRLARYQETGNTEHLVDCANLCLVEFVAGRHPNKHFSASDDAEHTEVR